MSTLALQIPSIPFPLQSLCLRLRKDLRWIPFRDSQRWVVLDPISNTYFTFNALEHQLALQLDGSRTTVEILRRNQHQTASDPPSPEWLEMFLTKLLRAELLETPPAMRMATGRGSFHRRASWRSLFSNPLSIRIPLLQPGIDGFWAKILAALCFAPAVVATVIALLAWVSFLVLMQVLSRPNELLYDLSKIQGDRWLALAVVLLITKSLHEFGHYLACVRFRVQCAEIGLLFLCFTPCLYCDTTDSWKLQSRWQRAGIAAAGVYFELILAILGGWIFLNYPSGLWHVLGGGMWLMCTLGTFILNANPLFRYDGYFVLSDILRAPNLASQANQAIWQGFIALLGGRALRQDEYDVPLRWLIPFAIASMIYRSVVLAGIFLFLWRFLLPMGLGVPFLLLSCVMLFGLLRNGANQSHSVFAELFSREPISWQRLLGFLLLIGGLLSASLFWPLPQRLVHRGYVERTHSVPMYASTQGVLTQVANWQEPILAGQTVLRLRNRELDLEVLQAEHKHQLLIERLKILEQAKSVDESVISEIPTVEQLLKESAATRDMLVEERSRLELIAPSDGVFIPKDSWVTTGFRQGGATKEFEPIVSERNLGLRLQRGELLGWFEGPGEFQAVVLVPMATLRHLQTDRSVRFLSDAYPNRTLPGTVVSIARDPVEVFPDELIDDPNFILERDEEGHLRSDPPVYRVRVRIDAGNDELIRGGRCSVRFDLPSETLATRILKSVREIFAISSNPF